VPSSSLSQGGERENSQTTAIGRKERGGGVFLLFYFHFLQVVEHREKEGGGKILILNRQEKNKGSERLYSLEEGRGEERLTLSPFISRRLERRPVGRLRREVKEGKGRGKCYISFDFPSFSIARIPKNKKSERGEEGRDHLFLFLYFRGWGRKRR